MKRKEEWIDEVMESLEGIRAVESNPFLYTKVMQGLSSPSETKYFLPRKYIWKVAAGLAFLIVINIFSLLVYNTSNSQEQTQVALLASEYFSYIETIY